MLINHLDLQVRDVHAVASFFEAHFGLRWQSSRSSPAIAILADDDGFVLVLQRKKVLDQTYPDGFHLGFLLEDVASVEAKHRELVAAGAPVSGLQRNGRGTQLYCRIDEGIVVEVSCRSVR